MRKRWESEEEVGGVLRYAYSDGDLSNHVHRYSSNRQDEVQAASVLQGAESNITTTISGVTPTYMSPTMCCMHMEISLLMQKLPKKPTMYGELHSCRTFSSRIIWLRTAGLMSNMII